MSDEFQFWLEMVTLGTLFLLSVLAMVFSVSGMRQAHQQALQQKKAHDPRFQGRSEMSLDQFFDEHYAARDYPRQVVADLVMRFATAARVPAGFLRSEDSFVSLQASGADVEQFIVASAMLMRETEVRLGTTLSEGELVTLDDYIRVSVLANRLAKSG